MMTTNDLYKSLKKCKDYEDIQKVAHKLTNTASYQIDTESEALFLMIAVLIGKAQ